MIGIKLWQHSFKSHLIKHRWVELFLKAWECEARQELSPFPEEYKLKASCNHIAGMQSVYTVKHSLSWLHFTLSALTQRSLCSARSWKAMLGHSPHPTPPQLSFPSRSGVVSAILCLSRSVSFIHSLILNQTEAEPPDSVLQLPLGYNTDSSISQIIYFIISQITVFQTTRWDPRGDCCIFYSGHHNFSNCLSATWKIWWLSKRLFYHML